MPSHEEIMEEFGRRQEVIDQRALQMDADIPTDTPAQSIFDNHTSRSITSLSTTDEVSLNTLQYIIQNYTCISVEGIPSVSEEVLRILLR